MKSFTLFFFSLVFLFQTVNAQVGIIAGYKTMQANDWEEVFPGDGFPSTGYSIGIDYWFKLKEKRIEFTPELNFSNFSETGLNSTTDFTARFVGFHFNTNIYPLDFDGDCQCPTWGKEGSFVEKGFFIRLSPGLNYFSSEIQAEDFNESGNEIIPSFGLGVGLDIGVAPVVTITPIAMYTRYFGATWTQLGRAFFGGEGTDIDSGLSHLFFGLKLGIRFDEIRNYR